MMLNMLISCSSTPNKILPEYDVEYVDQLFQYSQTKLYLDAQQQCSSILSGCEAAVPVLT